MESSRGRRIFYGWILVAAAFCMGFVTTGFYFYSRGIFLKPIAEDFGGSRFDLSLGFTIAGIVSSLVAPLMGYIVDHYPIRRIMTIAAIWLGLGYFALSLSYDKWTLFIALGLFISLGQPPLSAYSVPKLMVNWFTRRRGMALAIVAMGGSISGVFMPAIATWLIESFTWRGGFMVYGVGTIIIIVPLVLLLVREKPQDMGLLPDGSTQEQEEAAPYDERDERVWTTKESLRSPSFWSILLIFGMMGSIFGAILTHFYAHLTDIGIGNLEASYILSATAFMAMAGKPVFGWMVDRFEPRFAVGISIFVQIVSVAFMLWFTNYWLLLIAGILFGAGYGGMVPLRNAVTANTFGRRSFASVSGLMRPWQIPLIPLGLPLAGWAFDTYGSYYYAYLIFIGFYALSAFGLLFLKPPRRA
ncbi:MAG: MFS transporter [Pseudomonadota bacterium]